MIMIVLYRFMMMKSVYDDRNDGNYDNNNHGEQVHDDSVCV